MIVSARAWMALPLLILTAWAQATLIEQPGLVDADWLAERLEEPTLRVIDARPAIRSYLEGHVPGAVYMSPENFRASLGGQPARLLNFDELAGLLGRMGISKEHSVVIYSSGSDDLAASTFVAWMLYMVGHKNWAVLDGGIEAWTEAGYSTPTLLPKLGGQSLRPEIRSDARVGLTDMISITRLGGAKMLDARPEQQYLDGHISGALWFPLSSTLTEGTVRRWRSRDEIVDILTDRGVLSTDRLVTYCTTGMQGSQLWFTMRFIVGNPQTALYDGSMIDWTANDMPVSRG